MKTDGDRQARWRAGGPADLHELVINFPELGTTIRIDAESAPARGNAR